MTSSLSSTPSPKDDLKMEKYDATGLFNPTALSSIRHGRLDITQSSKGMNPDRLKVMFKLLDRYEIE